MVDVEAWGASEQTVTVDGVIVRYYVAGTTVDGQAPIVLVHGIGGSTRTHMSFLLPMLARRHRVIAVDFSPPATGGRSDLSVDFLADQIAGVIRQEVPGLAVGLLGYSLGAVACAALAGRDPDLVDRLVLVNGWLRSDAQQGLHSAIWQTLHVEGSDALQTFMAYCALSGEILYLMPPVEVDRAAAALRVDDFVAQQMDLVRRIDISDLATTIAAPTLVIGSRSDQIAPIRHSRALFGAIEPARYVEVSSGHAILRERAAEVLRAAESFFDAPTHHPAGAVLEAVRP